MNYSTSLTQIYKGGFIHSADIDGHSIIRAQVDAYAYPIQLKSILAAKQLISKHTNSGRSLSIKVGIK